MIRESKNVRGFLIEENEDSTISGIAILFSPVGPLWIRVGDTVVSNGRFGPQAGQKGTVVAIKEPFECKKYHCTDDVITVCWEGYSDRLPMAMKFKDLELPK